MGPPKKHIQEEGSKKKGTAPQEIITIRMDYQEGNNFVKFFLAI